MQLTKNILFAFLLTFVLTLTQCKKDDPSPDELLIGIWQWVEAGGETPDGILAVEFEADHDFEWCYTYEFEPECYDGVWNWMGDDFDSINLEIDYGSYDYSINMEIERLDETHLDVRFDGEALVRFIKL